MHGKNNVGIAAEKISDGSLNPWAMQGVRGRLRADVSLANRTWFQVGGAAQWLFTPEDVADLQSFLAQLPLDIPVTVIGVGSNLLVRDGGIKGVVIRLGRGFTNITLQQECSFVVGAAVLDSHLAHMAATHGIAGCEFLVGIPGTIGGAVRMNAGAYGADMSQILTAFDAVDRGGVLHHVTNAEAGFHYRHADFPDDWIVTTAYVQGVQGDAATISASMEKIMQERAESQPVRSRTGGSTFKNPREHKAWALIDAAGCRGLRIGDAHMSALHCNFMVNDGQATASALEQLGEEVRARVLAHTGIVLEWEIKRIGCSL
jgi:UDP-N-acetylmuramate dehydrogenase